ncbi:MULTISPECIES: 4-(cytidine 5'-diphospho)-2-C-methyl-D-erythritol kinase [Nitrosomonas]|uniref:4-diphosphocytidyl-2-C-methyl-D-erythritol kinase n=2 Tax=Nitrosomonas eutropha TaxID=916 RepID=ISPE_NITEC|nr:MULTISPECIES: 4-(cytidine 5'-diphospho)-2-C-methyl-D-erythritol kinase [Nitrosomonas]Q0AGY8.1 RecName: Full=4-diphosphocytidyl-2-C-methyl-D-erythritol kinase; Short=CMK; AltName: Full=4-(cytidine-5'-diphospho)-2-C-methyl-D-erythritol kinase [Nitrosomonas eutropha C91]ABI59394.1 4-diphosphocytidyl-2-C-methyl-D-erythritol kinase [Nitrosomonas eutropha C91]MXS79436.1 4-(cytidine 5'-diphospho)-2-C-methyl-D-erythritol kinase [Nitrosomonas sp. GH22]PXV83275.1 4-diphosphocytidyl-2-C-methyl-D-erythr
MNTFPAPAKLNLFLHVIGRRDDGYHLLQTVFRFIGYSDQLGFDVTNDGVIRHLNLVPGLTDTDDLCVRAAKLLQKRSGKEMLGVGIHLSKNIPLGGGLGGGSSDAATTLIVLNRLWGINWGRERLMALGLELGADVPIFIYGRNAFAEGVGEKLEVINLPPAWYVVLTPPAPISTAAVFASRELTRNTIPIKMAAFSMAQGHNDLELVAMRLQPVIAEWLDWLKGRHGSTKVAMSGSGSCVFAEFPSESAAREVLRQLPDSMSGFIAPGLARHPLSDF